MNINQEIAKIWELAETKDWVNGVHAIKESEWSFDPSTGRLIQFDDIRLPVAAVFWYFMQFIANIKRINWREFNYDYEVIKHLRINDEDWTDASKEDILAEVRYILNSFPNK